MPHENELQYFGQQLKQCCDDHINSVYERILRDVMIFARFMEGGSVFHERRIDIAYAIQYLLKYLHVHDPPLAQACPVSLCRFVDQMEETGHLQYVLATSMLPFIEDLFLSQPADPDPSAITGVERSSPPSAR